MRIVILSINYWPEETGIGPYTTHRAEYLAGAGHEVTVCTTFPYYPEWKVNAQFRGKFASTEVRNGVKILRSRAYVPNPVTSVRRIAHEATFVFGSLVRAAMCRRPDLLFVISPPLGLGLSAFLLSRMWRRPYVFDVMDLQPDAAAELGMLPPRFLRMLYGVERFAYRHAALVSTLTRGMRSKIVSKGLSEDKVALFEPRADDALFDIQPSEGLAFRQRYGLGEKFLVTHSGNMGVKQGVEVIVEAASLTRNDVSLVYVMVGDGVARATIESHAQRLGLDNIQFMPVLNAAEFRGLLAASNVCLVTQRRTVSDVVFPSKVVTYMAAGCPVIASVKESSEVARAVCESHAGLVVEPESPEALAGAIAQLRKQSLEEIRRNASQFARRHWSAMRVLPYLERSLVAASTTIASSFAAQ